MGCLHEQLAGEVLSVDAGWAETVGRGSGGLGPAEQRGRAGDGGVMRELLTNLKLRWRTLWKRRQLERDLEDELAFHLAMRGENARRAFGNVERVKEDLRDQWT